MADFYTTFTSYIREISYSLILAQDNRGGIGLKNDLPWKNLVDNKEDMKWFRDNTRSKIIVMGYNTWVSIGSKPLPGRINVVITGKHAEQVAADVAAHQLVLDAEGKGKAKVMVCASPEIAVETIARERGNSHHGGEVMVMGGATIYEAFMRWTSRIYLTTFEGEFEADTFVHLSLEDWNLVYRDARSCLKPKFEIFECTEYAATRPDSEVIQIEHTHKLARAEVIEFKRKDENV